MIKKGKGKRGRPKKSNSGPTKQKNIVNFNFDSIIKNNIKMENTEKKSIIICLKIKNIIELDNIGTINI